MAHLMSWGYTTRKPCPYRMYSDVGMTVLLGAVGGFLFRAFKTFKRARTNRLRNAWRRGKRGSYPMAIRFTVWAIGFSGTECLMTWMQDGPRFYHPLIGGGLAAAVSKIGKSPYQVGRSFTKGFMIMALIEGVIALFSQDIRHFFVNPRYNWTPPPDDTWNRAPLGRINYEDDDMLEDVDQIPFLRELDLEPRTWVYKGGLKFKKSMLPFERISKVPARTSSDSPISPIDLINWGPTVPKWKVLATIVRMEHILGLNKTEFDREL